MSFFKKLASASILLLGLLCALNGVHAATTRVIEVTVPNATNVKMTLPPDWQQDNVGYSTGLAPIVRFHSDKSKNLAVQLTFFEDKDGLSTQDKIDQKVKWIGDRQYAPHSVEGKVNLVRFNSEHLLGSYAKFTHKKFANEKSVVPPNYRYVTSGAFTIGKSIGTFTLLSNSTDDETYKKAINFLSNTVTKK